MSAAAFARINVALAFAGLFIASMLSMSHVLGIELPCGIGSGCDLVTQDPRSQLLGIPFAYFGVLGYTMIATIMLVRLFAPGFMPRALHNTGYVLSLIGLVVSTGLTVFSIRSIHALCTWCIASAVTISLLFVSHSMAAMKDRPVSRPHALDGIWVVVLLCALFAGLATGATGLKTAQSNALAVDRTTLNDLDADELLPPEAHVTGPTSAKAVVVMFGDLTCPVCREAYQTITALMKRRHDFRFAFRQLPLTFHPYARPAALISEMAAEKGRFWDFATSCYENYPNSIEDLVQMGANVGLDANTVRRRLRDPNDPAAQVIEDDAAVTRKLGLHSTPSVFIVIEGYFPEPITYKGIEEMLDHNTAIKRVHG